MPPKENVFDLGAQEARAHHPLCGLHAPSEGPSDLVPPRKALHMSRPCKDEQIHPLRAHKSQV
jgi:hypothetical protein